MGNASHGHHVSHVAVRNKKKNGSVSSHLSNSQFDESSIPEPVRRMTVNPQRFTVANDQALQVQALQTVLFSQLDQIDLIIDMRDHDPDPNVTLTTLKQVLHSCRIQLDRYTAQFGRPEIIKNDVDVLGIDLDHVVLDELPEEKFEESVDSKTETREEGIPGAASSPILDSPVHPVHHDASMPPMPRIKLSTISSGHEHDREDGARDTFEYSEMDTAARDVSPGEPDRRDSGRDSGRAGNRPYAHSNSSIAAPAKEGESSVTRASTSQASQQLSANSTPALGAASGGETPSAISGSEADHSLTPLNEEPGGVLSLADISLAGQHGRSPQLKGSHTPRAEDVRAIPDDDALPVTTQLNTFSSSTSDAKSQSNGRKTSFKSSFKRVQSAGFLFRRGKKKQHQRSKDETKDDNCGSSPSGNDSNDMGTDISMLSPNSKWHQSQSRLDMEKPSEEFSYWEAEFDVKMQQKNKHVEKEKSKQKMLSKKRRSKKSPHKSSPENTMLSPAAAQKKRTRFDTTGNTIDMSKPSEEFSFWEAAFDSNQKQKEMSAKREARLAGNRRWEELGSDILLNEVAPYLYSYERFRICTVCNYFHETFSQSKFRHFLNDLDYWATHLRPYWDDTEDCFMLTDGKLLQMSEEQSMHFKFFCIFYEIFVARSALSSIRFPTAIETLYITDHINYPDRSSKNQLVRMLSDFLHYSTPINRIDWIMFNKNALSDTDLHFVIDYGLNRRLFPSSIQLLSFSSNYNITDKEIPFLCDTIARQCPKLQFLRLENMKISDKSCEAIQSFYEKRCGRTRLHCIHLSHNKRITHRGVDCLNSVISKNLMPKTFQPIFFFYVINCGFRKADPNWDSRIITVPKKK